MPSEQKCPDRVEFYLSEHDDLLDGYLLLREWTPFEAACLIRGFRPGEISHGIAKVGVILPHAIDQQSIDEFRPLDPTASDDLILLARAIADNNGATMVRAQEVVRWAQERGLIDPDSRLGRFASSQPAPDAADAPEVTTEAAPPPTSKAYEGTGQHHEKKRLAILGFVIQELVRNINSEKIARLTCGEEINGAGLAEHMHAFRSSIGMPSEETTGFSLRALENCIRNAVRAAKDCSTDKD